MVTVTEEIDIITHSTRSKYKIVAYDKYTISKQGTKIRLFNKKKLGQLEKKYIRPQVHTQKKWMMA